MRANMSASNGKWKRNLCIISSSASALYIARGSNTLNMAFKSCNVMLCLEIINAKIISARGEALEHQKKAAQYRPSVWNSARASIGINWRLISNTRAKAIYISAYQATIASLRITIASCNAENDWRYRGILSCRNGENRRHVARARHGGGISWWIGRRANCV